MNKIVAIALGLALIVGYLKLLMNPGNTKEEMQVLAFVGAGLVLSAVFVWG